MVRAADTIMELAFWDINSLAPWITYFAGILIASDFHKSLCYHADSIVLIELWEQGEATAQSSSMTHYHARAWKMSTNIPPGETFRGISAIKN